MPSLPAPLQEQAQTAADEGGAFSALDSGVYIGRLSKVTPTTTKEKKDPMWGLEFDSITDLEGNKKPGRQWTNLVLIEQVMWKVGQFFGAFGVPTDTNTDELINHRIRLSIDQRVITQGKNTGQMGNEISAFLPLQEGDEGYELAQRLKRNAGGGGAKPAKAAPTKAAAKPAAEKATEPEAEAASAAPEEDPDAAGVDF